MTTENDAILQEMLLNAEKAAEPGELAKNKVISKGDTDDSPLPMIASKLLSAGYCFVYDKQTGERSTVNMNMLPSQLKKKHADGTLAFTTIKPAITPKRGIFKCMLHVDDPNREYYDSLGMASCKKSNLTSPYQVRRHMQKRHKDEWAALEEEKKLKETDRSRLLNESLLAQLVESLPQKKVTK